MAFTPQRSTLGRFCRSALGVRGQCTPNGRCGRLRKYIPCDLTADQERCADPSVTVWVCLPVACAPGQKIHWRNRCYRPADGPIDIDHSALLPGDIVLRADVGADPAYVYGCEDDCSSPNCTVCQLFIRAEKCPTFGTPPVPVPTIWVPAHLVTACGIAASGNYGGVWVCWTVKPGPTSTLAEIGALIPGVNEIAGSPPTNDGTDCCDCNPQCGGRVQITITDCTTGVSGPGPRCCCAATYFGTVTFRFEQFIRTPPNTNLDYAHVQVSGTAIYSVSNYSDIIPPGFIDGTITYYQGGVVIQVLPVRIQAPRWHCGLEAYFPMAVDEFNANILIPGQEQCPWSAGPIVGGTGLEVIDARLLTLCNSAKAQGSWRYLDSGVSVIETSVFCEWNHSNADPCGANCSGSTTTTSPPGFALVSGTLASCGGCGGGSDGALI